ncbi:MAG: hypothetical protein HQM12_21075 [SAR324 cluster bacterium]|nr:hypothetical protein [SAR324 cluster bacterium]
MTESPSVFQWESITIEEDDQKEADAGKDAEKTAKKKSQKKGKGKSGDESGKKNSEESLLKLHELYLTRAKPLKLPSKIMHQHPVGHLQLVPTDLYDTSLNQIKWSSTRPYPVRGGTEWWFYRKEIPIYRHQGSLPQATLPDFAFVLDSSASMGFDPYHAPENENAFRGAYDLALRTYYSVIRHLSSAGKGVYLRFAAINFSSATHYSGWHSIDALWEITKVLLPHQGKDTTLDIEILQRMANEATRPFLMILITDSGISNQSEVNQTLIQMRHQGQEIIYIQINDPGTSQHEDQELKTAGIHNIIIQNSRDLENLVLDITHHRYGIHT